MLRHSDDEDSPSLPDNQFRAGQNSDFTIGSVLALNRSEMKRTDKTGNILKPADYRDRYQALGVFAVADFNGDTETPLDERLVAWALR